MEWVVGTVIGVAILATVLVLNFSFQRALSRQREAAFDSFQRALSRQREAAFDLMKTFRDIETRALQQVINAKWGIGTVPETGLPAEEETTEAPSVFADHDTPLFPPDDWTSADNQEDPERKDLTPDMLPPGIWDALGTEDMT